MASVSKDKNGNVTIQFVGGDKKRRSVRLGKVNQKVANEVKLKVEALNALLITELPMDTDLATWVAGVGDTLHAKLAAVGLLAPRQSTTLGRYLTEYVDRRRKENKPNTVTNIERVATDLIALFGRDVGLRTITAEKAESFKAAYVDQGLAGATVHRRLKFAKMLFAHAVKKKLIPDNPFAGVTVPNVLPADRRQYVSVEAVEKLMAVSNPTWRTIVALCRYAGLRCPSEVLSLKWKDIDFAAGRMTVTAPKTEHIAGKETRPCPVFARLRPYLEDAHKVKSATEVYVIGGSWGDGYRETAGAGWRNANLRTQILKLIARAGLTPWAKPFHNLRASCETDLVREHPLHVVTAWLGNTPSVATTHYLQVLNLDFQKAIRGGAESGAPEVQKAVQLGAIKSDQEKIKVPEVPKVKGDTVPSESFWSVLNGPEKDCEYTQQESNLQPSVP